MPSVEKRKFQNISSDSVIQPRTLQSVPHPEPQPEPQSQPQTLETSDVLVDEEDVDEIDGGLSPQCIFCDIHFWIFPNSAKESTLKSCLGALEMRAAALSQVLSGNNTQRSVSASNLEKTQVGFANETEVEIDDRELSVPTESTLRGAVFHRFVCNLDLAGVSTRAAPI
jgi:hypothetical protein